ncbi:MAG: putative porin, partial [Bacteroidota bacterium]
MERTSKLVALARFWGMLLFGVLLTSEIGAQRDSLTQKLSFTGDFRFRIEHDWNSRNASGNLRDDRSRLRYRFRFGLHYELDKHSAFGGRLRTGNINDQQGPHLTLGGENGEFGLDQIGLEKLYYQYCHKQLRAWIGKNSINLVKEHELFWNDNVFPEGVALHYDFPFGKEKAVNDLQLNLSHFIIRANNQTFDRDAYLQVVQLRTRHLGGKLSLFPGLYRFRNIDNLQDIIVELKGSLTIRQIIN